MGSTISSYDGLGHGVGSTAQGWLLADSTAEYPYLTSDLMVSHLEVSVGDPAAVVEVRVGRYELDQAYSGLSGFYHRGSINVSTLPGLYGPWSDPPSYFLHQTLGAYYLSGGHPLQLRYEEEIEALKKAEPTHDHAFAVWIKRVDSADEVPYHINVRFEVNR